MKHPAVDLCTSATALISQQRSVVGLSTWLLDAANSCAAAGRRLQLLTPITSRLTRPAADVLRCDDADWVVWSDGGASDGFTGRPMSWHGQGFTPDGPAPAVGLPSSSGGAVVLDLVVRHRLTASTEVGGVLEDCVAGLTGGEVTGWGVAEPVTQRWSRARLTEFCRERAPRPTKLVVVGRPSVLGTLAVAVVGGAVLEHLHVGVGSPAGADQAAVDRLRTRLVARYDVRLAHATFQPGRTDGTVEPVPPRPLAR
ncbi:DUF6177 family protein [Actinosynnema sp. CS-041913]|uniref:DUF6177 family protein n=1 Tax=Actinosynnema sp. CS-041913 TaxID=3239917 RepID=UPI003D8CA1C4